ncbi:MAG: tetratricopeptide repeat protein [Verrucomicrobia bacterium]|nr:tetratricopeptide repeat protein [Verrucomicrobiota bacterium]
MSQHPFALYNPALLPPDVLLGEYTARLPMLETLLGIVRGNKPGHPPQHCLLIGARGMGKTTTLWALAHRISRDAELSRQWQPIVFDEESRRVGDLADFWLEAIRHWEAATKDTTDRAGKLLIENPPDIEDHAQRSFLDLVKQRGKRAILLIDNLNDLFASIRDPEPLHRLRAFLMQDSSVMLIGGATSYFEQVTDVDQPFFDFFRYFELKALTLDEMRDCLLNLAKTRGDPKVEASIKERSGSIQALHLFTGGNPRLIKTFYRLLHDGLHTDIRADLEKLLDDFTPYFKAIVDALPFQQQRIFDSIALAWDPVEVASIATATRLPSNQVSAQIRALIKAGLLREAAGNPKRKTYLLTDRFSNIHYLMRHGRAARNRLDWFVAMVRILFPDQQAAEVLARLAHDSAECGPLGMQDARDVLHCALTRSVSADSRRHLIHSTLRESWDGKALASLSDWFDIERAKQDLPEMEIIAFCQHMPAALRKELKYQPESARWWYSLTNFLEKRAALNLAESAYRKAIELDPKDAYPWYVLGNLEQTHLNRPAEAESAYRKAIELDPKFAFAWISLGSLLHIHLNRPAEAESAYRKTIELDPKFSDPWSGLAVLLLNKPDAILEARRCAVTALTLEPDDGFVRRLFLHLCADQVADWQAVMPALAEWCVQNPKAMDVFNFTVDGLVRYARLTKPSDALALLPSSTHSSAFETVRDALIACDNKDHLHRLAPERQVVALELMKRIQGPKPEVKKTAGKKVRKPPSSRPAPQN